MSAPAVAREKVGKTTMVAVLKSKLNVGNPVGKGASVSVAVGEIVGVGESVGITIAEGFGVDVRVGGPGVQVIKMTVSAPGYVSVMAGDCCPVRVKNVDARAHIQMTESNPITTRNILPLNLCFENQTGNSSMIFMFFHLD